MNHRSEYDKFMLSPLRGWDVLRFAPVAPNKGVMARIEKPIR